MYPTNHQLAIIDNFTSVIEPVPERPHKRQRPLKALESLELRGGDYLMETRVSGVVWDVDKHNLYNPSLVNTWH